jgi:hypothetical protein
MRNLDDGQRRQGATPGGDRGPRSPAAGQTASSRGEPPADRPPEGGYFEEETPGRPLKLWYLEPKTNRRLAGEFANERPALTRNQLRRFFNHCTTIRRRLQADGTLPWEHETARDSFMKLASSAAEAKGKGKIPDLFCAFLIDHVERVRTKDDFLRGFMPHFESIVGFSALFIER